MDDNNAEVFRRQPDNIYIWCNADCYVRRNGLKGFSTGMFISEPREAMLLQVDATDEEIEVSNRLFAGIVGDSFELSSREIYQNILENYYIEGNNVVAYNHQRMFCFD